MRLLVDESSGRRLAALLAQEGHDVVYCGDALPRMEDAKILAYAEKERRILVTDDKDFGELVWRLGKPAFGVVLLRFSTANERTKKEVLQEVFVRYAIEGHFTMVNEYSVRQRKL